MLIYINHLIIFILIQKIFQHRNHPLGILMREMCISFLHFQHSVA